MIQFQSDRVTCRAWEGGCWRAKEVDPALAFVISGLSKHQKREKCSQEEDELASTGLEVGQTLCGHLLYAESQGGGF